MQLLTEIEMGLPCLRSKGKKQGQGEASRTLARLYSPVALSSGRAFFAQPCTTVYNNLVQILPAFVLSILTLTVMTLLLAKSCDNWMAENG